MATTKKHAAGLVPPACPLQPRGEKTRIRISTIKPSPRSVAHDLIPDILIRLPPRSVARFRSVCKDWLAVISDPGFVDEHLQAAKQRPSSLLMVPTTFYERRGIPLLMGLYKYRAGEDAEPMQHYKKLPRNIKMRNSPVHCDGMVLIAAKAERMMICNPATGEVVRLPRAGLGVFDDRAGAAFDDHLLGHESLIRFTSRTGLGLDPRSKKYKVVRFFYLYQYGLAGGYDAVCKFEVLTLGTNEWRPTADDPPYPIAGRTPVHVQGFIYWMLIKDTPTWVGAFPQPPQAFLRFSLADEKFSLVPCPPSEYEPARFVQSDRELCCTCFCEQKRELEVWSLGVGRENPEWTRHCTVVIGSDLVLLDYNGLPRRSPKVILHGRTLIMTAESKVYQYDMNTNRMDIIALDIHDIRYYDQWFNQKNIVLHLTNYVESLVRIGEL